MSIATRKTQLKRQQTELDALRMGRAKNPTLEAIRADGAEILWMAGMTPYS